MQLRYYQREAIDTINRFFDRGNKFLLYALPTGAGKTVVAAEVIRRMSGNICAIAHRQELVSQISGALAENGIEHRIIAPKSVIRAIIQEHIEDHGRSWYNPQAKVAVAGVDTLIPMEPNAWTRSVRFWFIDECHHLLRENKWGKAVAMLPNAVGLGVTATPGRADGKGLGAHADGVFEQLIEGIDTRELIDQGYLSDYRIFAPESDMDFSDLRIGKTGDVSPQQLRTKIVQSNRIIGDIVESYIKFAGGKRGVTFVPDVATATEVCAAYNARGVPAEVVSAKTPGKQRRQAIKQLERGEVLQLVNVDLFGEGFDLPAIECVSLARRTESLNLFRQQVGRALRPMPGKTHAIIIDHVENYVRHGLPDSPKVWSLDRRERKHQRADDELPIRRCLECLGVYESWERTCPYCGYRPIPQDRSRPEFVEGNLVELDPSVLEGMRQAAYEAIHGPAKIPYGVNGVVAKGIQNKHEERQKLAVRVQQLIDEWAARQLASGLSVPGAYVKFYRCFNIDAISACTQRLGKLRLTCESILASLNDEQER